MVGKACPGRLLAPTNTLQKAWFNVMSCAESKYNDRRFFIAGVAARGADHLVDKNLLCSQLPSSSDVIVCGPLRWCRLADALSSRMHFVR
jgi:hypothetical protein